MSWYSYLVTSLKSDQGQPEAISDKDVIAAITESSNWDDQNQYTGSVKGLDQGNYYNDDLNHYKYEFQDGKLRRIYLSATASGAPQVIDHTVINRMTDESLWHTSEGYTGSVEGLKEGDYYYDDLNQQKYEFSGGRLRRFSFNTMV